MFARELTPSLSLKLTFQTSLSPQPSHITSHTQTHHTLLTQYALTQTADSGDRIVIQSDASSAQLESVTLSHTDLFIIGELVDNPYTLDFDGGAVFTVLDGGDITFQNLRVVTTNTAGYVFNLTRCGQCELVNIFAKAAGGVAYFSHSNSHIGNLEITDYDYDGSPGLTSQMGVPLFWYEYGAHTAISLNVTLSTAANAEHASLFYLRPMPEESVTVQSFEVQYS